MTATRKFSPQPIPWGEHNPSMENGTRSRPRILICTSGVSGHAVPMLRVAEQLVKRDYEVTFLAIDEFQTAVENVGAIFKHIDMVDLSPLEEVYRNARSPVDVASYFIRSNVIDVTAYHQERLYSTLEEMQSSYYTAGQSAEAPEIVVIIETFFVGATPLYYGGSLPRGFTRRPLIINLHALGYMVGSVDLAPFGLGLKLAITQKERDAHRGILDSLLNGPFDEVNLLYEQEIKRLGGVDFQRERDRLPYEICSVSNDVCLHMSPPSLEYAISDRHPKVKFIGALPHSRNKKSEMPGFWDEVVSGDQKVVVVTQGTVELDYKNLICPTMYALEASSDVLVVAILGRKGASLGDARISRNARVVDYLSYDAILPHASAFVFNAGYGGLIHGMLHGVPMIFAGQTEEKPEVANRGEYAGVGINLATGRPSKEQLRQAITQVLGDDRYKSRVVQIQLENEALRAMDSIEQTIRSFPRP